MPQTFAQTLAQIRAIAQSETHKGNLFERLMVRYLEEDPLYGKRFRKVHLWKDWRSQKGLSTDDIGIDLVAECYDDELAAIQCKFHAPETTLQREALNSFIAASSRVINGKQEYAERIIIDTGTKWGKNLKKLAREAKPRVTRLEMDPLHTEPYEWPDLSLQGPDKLKYNGSKHDLLPHQQDALENVIQGFSNNDRGKLIMACGTGKTFTALRIAEIMAGSGKRILYLVPSISLLAQSMREWANQAELSHRYIGVCSDSSAGRDDDIDLTELELSVTTDGAKIVDALRGNPPDQLTVVFSTYQSLHLIANAHANGVPEFDLAICDEAHRTTGIDRTEDRENAFQLIHDEDRILAKKRLYMTATPRIYGSAARNVAADFGRSLYTMDDETIYGPEFHTLTFGNAVDQGLLTDYRVAILTVHESFFSNHLNTYANNADLPLNEAAKMLGCWTALENPENTNIDEPDRPRAGRVLAFANNIKYSKLLEKHWPRIVEQYIDSLPEASHSHVHSVDCQHVDGTMDSKTRAEHLDWLRSDTKERSRILCNVRCLAEGVDVPALDGIVFMSPKSSETDIVQAVGRVMRKSEGKRYGYIILPVAIPPSMDPDIALDQHEGFQVIWKVLRALRSHDKRFDAEINKINLNINTPERISLIDARQALQGEKVTVSQGELTLSMPDIPPGKLYAKIVEKCGDRQYWPKWGKDVAETYKTIETRAQDLLNSGHHPELASSFEKFEKELEAATGISVESSEAVSFLAQHLITGPVFDALFEDSSFTAHNPVALALDQLRIHFDNAGLTAETKYLEPFYESIRQRAQVDNAEARQRVLIELFDNFFKNALEEQTKQLGIVYTPVELVDFVLKSTDEILREEFDRNLTDEGVDIFDPFTGTGTFIVRLFQIGLIRAKDRKRKFEHELHANELMLLAYYIAAANIERTYQGGPEDEIAYTPFPGILWGDTFKIGYEGQPSLPSLMNENADRGRRQRMRSIKVIVSNPPWSANRGTNPMDRYPIASGRITSTYSARSTAKRKAPLYNLYKIAIRYATDRILGVRVPGISVAEDVSEEGVIGFITSGSWLDGNADDGLRATLYEEFDTIHVVDLRGNALKGTEEGGNVFDIKQPVTLLFLVRRKLKNDQSKRAAKIFYYNIGDFLSKNAKLGKLKDAGTLSGLKNRTTIEPNKQNDWVNQRPQDYSNLIALSQEKGSATKEITIFKVHTTGQLTGRDKQIYNFSQRRCLANGENMIAAYTHGLEILKNNPEVSEDHLNAETGENLHWIGPLVSRAKQKKLPKTSAEAAKLQYRPFVKMWAYTDPFFIHSRYLTHKMFPTLHADNMAIGTTSRGALNPFSAYATKLMPDYELMSKGKWFPRWRYESKTDVPSLLDVDPEGEKIDNITDEALNLFRTTYPSENVAKDDIFEYVYGVLHAPDWRSKYKHGLAKEMIRIPLAKNFRVFANAGKKLLKLCLDEEAETEVSLTVRSAKGATVENDDFLLTSRRMRLSDDKKSLKLNESLTLHGIPQEAVGGYEINGKSPLGWLIDRYRVETGAAGHIVNNPNDWFENPKDIVGIIENALAITIEAKEIIDSLPSALEQ